MTIEQFIEEAQHLARPVFHLTKNQSDGAPLAAYWGGSPLVTHPMADDPEFRHWLSIDCRFLPAGFEDLKGCLSVYANENEEEGVVAVDASMQIDSTSQSVPGLPLFAHPATSWPPIEAIFKLGSPMLREWNIPNQPRQESPDDYRREKSAILSAYNEHVRMRNPLFGMVRDAALAQRFHRLLNRAARIGRRSGFCFGVLFVRRVLRLVLCLWRVVAVLNVVVHNERPKNSRKLIRNAPTRHYRDLSQFYQTR